MVYYGFWLVSMVIQGGFMVFHGFWLVSMGFRGGFMVFHGFWFVSMVFQGIFMVFHCFWLFFFMVFQGIFIVFHGFGLVLEKRNKVGEKYIVVKKSELSAEGTKRDVENTPKFTCPDCILAQ